MGNRARPDAFAQTDKRRMYMLIRYTQGLRRSVMDN
jgi:hypothetical protein